MSKQLTINDKRQSQEIVQHKNRVATIDETLHIAVQQKYDVEAIKELVKLKMEVDKANAEKAFNNALSIVQQEINPVIARGENRQTGSMYGKLEDINIMLMPVIGKNGFSISFNQEKSEIEKHIRITGTLSHTEGHSRKYWVDLPLDQAGIAGKVNKTPMHATGSSFTYGQRYLIKMIFNVAIVGEDDDGNAAGNQVETITEAQETILTKLIGVKDSDLPLLDIVLETYKIESLSDLPAEMFSKCKARIEKRKAAK